MLVRRGRNAVVRQRNGLTAGMTVHLHGGHVPASSDGHPMDLIAPGGFKDYFYPNTQLPATLWYHDHAMDATATNVYRGLAGFYIISDDLEDELPLPKGRFEVPLVIQDRSFNTDGSLLYNPNMMNGFLGGSRHNRKGGRGSGDGEEASHVRSFRRGLSPRIAVEGATP